MAPSLPVVFSVALEVQKALAAMNAPQYIKRTKRRGASPEQTDPEEMILEHLPELLEEEMMSRNLWFWSGRGRRERGIKAKDPHSIQNYLTVLMQGERPATKKEKEEFLEGKPTTVRQVTLEWPLAGNAWQCPAMVQKIVWTFTAWAGSESPYMPEGFYWKQKMPRIEKGRVLSALPDSVNMDFPFKLVRGANPEAEQVGALPPQTWKYQTMEEFSEEEISSDDSDEELGAEYPPAARVKPFRWSDHPAVKTTRQQYREAISARAKRGSQPGGSTRAAEPASATPLTVKEGKLQAQIKAINIYDTIVPVPTEKRYQFPELNGIEILSSFNSGPIVLVLMPKPVEVKERSPEGPLPLEERSSDEVDRR